jgi:hypothetical protein
MRTEWKSSSILTGLIWFILGSLVISVPLTFYLLAHENSVSRLETEVEVNAMLLSRVISENPEYWQFIEHRLIQSLMDRPVELHMESWRIYNINNEIVLENSREVDEPLITRSYDLNDSATVVGRLEVTASLRPILKNTALVFLLVLPIGLVLFIAINRTYIKQIKDTEIVEQESREKLESANRELHKEIEERMLAEAERERVIAELKDALAEIKQLSELLPICSSCKKIRDDQGYWNQIEVYLNKHSGLEFTHGLCPECAKKLYPDFFLDRQQPENKDNTA